jgi:nitrate reductase NapAB chaperone NapD
MKISGLIVTLEPSQERRENAVRLMGEKPSFLLGECDGDHLPVAMEAASSQDAENEVRWLQDLPGVLFVDVVYVHESSDCG